MPKIVEVPNFGPVEFPDGMSDADIVKAIKKTALDYGKSDKRAWMNEPAPSAKQVLDEMSTTEKFLAGMGKRFSDIGTLGMRTEAPAEKTLMAETPAMLGGALTDLGTMLAGGAALKGVQGASKAAQVARAVGQNLVAPQTATKAAAAGGAWGALTDAGGVEDRLASGVLGAIGGAAVPVATAVAKGGKAFFEPLTKKGQERIAGRTINRFLGNNADESIAAMKNPTALVPGSNPNAVEASGNAGLASLYSGLQSVDPVFKQDATERAMQNIAARRSALKEIAGDDDLLAAAKADREGAAQSLYSRAFDSDKMRQDMAAQELERLALARTGGIQVVNPTKGAAATGSDVSQEVLNDPAMLQYLGLGSQPNPFAIAAPLKQTAETAAKTAQKGPGFAPIVTPEMPTPGLQSLAERPVFKAALSDAQESMQNRGMKDVPLNSLQGLHLAKLSIDATLNGSAPNSALAAYDKATLQTIKKELLKEIESISPLYENARKTFAEMSKPINQMEVGQAFYNKVAPALSDFGANMGENAATYAKALREADKTAANATGFRAARLADVMTPEQVQTLQAVGKDLARASDALAKQRGVGPNTAQNLGTANLLRQAFGPLGMPQSFLESAFMQTLAKPINAIYSGVGEAGITNALGRGLLDPQVGAALAEAAARRPSGLLGTALDRVQYLSPFGSSLAIQQQ